MFSQIFKVLKNPNSFLIWSISTVFVSIVWYIYSDVEYVKGNYQSIWFAYYDVGLSWMMILLFPLLIAGIVYRSLYFGARGLTDRPTGFFGVLSGIAGVLITGLACCGVSLISVLGLTSLIGFLDILPFHGIEVKTLAISVLIYSVYDIYSHLEVCKIKK